MRTSAISHAPISSRSRRSPKIGFIRRIALAAAFFTKGPLALLIVSMPVVADALIAKSMEPIRRINPILGLLLLLLLIGAWLIAEVRIYGTEFVLQQLGGETVGRVLEGDHEEPWWYY